MAAKPFRLSAPKALESDLQGQIIDYLRAMQIHGKIVWFARGNGGAVVAGVGKARRFIQFYRLYLRGREPTGQGMADVYGQLPGGRYFALECKQPGKKATQAQLDFLETVGGGGGIAAVVFSFEDAKSVLFGKIEVK